MIETIDEAAEKWVFETNGHKWSNNDDTAGDNYGSFKEGTEHLKEIILTWLDNQIEVGKDCDGDTRDFETMKIYINNL